MTPEQAAADMRERAAQIAATATDDPLFDCNEGFVRRVGSWIALRIRALPLPVAEPDPRDEALKKARGALAWYAEQVSNCNRMTDESARNHLARDLGGKATSALAAITAAFGDAAQTTEPA